MSTKCCYETHLSALTRYGRYSVENAAKDLGVLVTELGIRRFHLYGHSFGGMIAYEYLKEVAEKKSGTASLSVVLSSTSTSMPIAIEEWEKLLKDLDGDMGRFRSTHQCRCKERPEPLARAFQKAGSTWIGMDVVKEYELSPPTTSAAKMPNALILRGEHDFTTERCTRGFASLFKHDFVSERVLEGCSHHGLLERGDIYGSALQSFFLANE